METRQRSLDKANDRRDLRGGSSGVDEAHESLAKTVGRAVKFVKDDERQALAAGCAHEVNMVGSLNRFPIAARHHSQVTS